MSTSVSGIVRVGIVLILQEREWEVGCVGVRDDGAVGRGLANGIHTVLAGGGGGRVGIWCGGEQQAGRGGQSVTRGRLTERQRDQGQQGEAGACEDK